MMTWDVAASNFNRADRGCSSALINKIKTLFMGDTGTKATTGARTAGPVPDPTSAAGSARAVKITTVPASFPTTGGEHSI